MNYGYEHDSPKVSKTNMAKIINAINESHNIKVTKKELWKETSKVFAFWKKQRTKVIVFEKKWNKERLFT